jgi:hypothetical protein
MWNCAGKVKKITAGIVPIFTREIPALDGTDVDGPVIERFAAERHLGQLRVSRDDDAAYVF